MRNFGFGNLSEKSVGKDFSPFSIFSPSFPDGIGSEVVAAVSVVVW